MSTSQPPLQQEHANWILRNLYDYSSTPYPAWGAAGLYLSMPIISPAITQPIAVTSSLKNKLMGKVITPSSFNTASEGYVLKSIGPSIKNCLLFGGCLALGGYIVYDGDLESGSGFIGAWSTLYLIVNGKKSINCLKYSKFIPIVGTVFALNNALTYGRRFIMGDTIIPNRPMPL
ncbi:Aim19p SCDLUD_002742 [Saccharomycodes ludwigii]|uniref:Aim19p n=1 Tax=Saccharomycodes ludwigii TaxID=36035 RepID=UPI001E8C0DA2|nr:hypothetical protein SCDLUD_002742 [Saccharomycodes ludwigii]KAH3901253.1 hypothetical protein SCDLUD_002742 [Saccharomycodes ludwigii]